MNIFLSGKMDAKHGAWRDALLGNVYDLNAKRVIPRWESVRGSRSEDGVGWFSDPLDGCGQAVPADGFPRESNTWVLGLHEYVGPYRLTWADDDPTDSSSSGYFHGSTGRGSHGQIDDEDRERVARACLNGIARADFVFAYINTPDCFGTLAEIGYARALGKYVHVAQDDAAEWDWDDYWFVAELADSASYVRSEAGTGDIREHLKDALVRWTAKPAKAPATGQVAIVRPTGLSAERSIALQSFQQIARWSADPRVRDEAERMVRRLQAG